MPRPNYKIFKDLGGGLNDTTSEVKLTPRESNPIRNIDLDKDGAIVKRRGAVKQTGSPLAGAPECNMLVYFQPSAGSGELLAAFGTKLKKWAAGVYTDLFTGLNATAIVLPAPFRNLCFFSNGIDSPLVYYPGRGASPYVWRAGVPQPSSGVTFNANIAGSIVSTGTILVRVRFVSPIDDTDVGEPYPEAGASITVTASGGVRINIPTYGGTEHEVTKRVIERTTVGGGIFYQDGFVADNTTGTYDITQSDASLLANDIMPDVGRRLRPPLLMPVTVAGNRVVGADAADIGKVVWSEIDEFGLIPNAFPAENYVYLDIGDYADAPIACQRFGEYVVFYCGRSTHIVYIDPGGQGQSRRVGGHELGVPGPRCVVELPYGHIVWTYKGPFLFDLQNFVSIGERISTFHSTLPYASLQNMFVIHRYNRRQLKFVFPGPNSSVNNVAAKYHYRRQTLGAEGFPTDHAWVIDDGFRAKSGTIFRDQATRLDTEMSGDYAGNLYIEDTTETDDRNPDGTGAIEGEFVSAWLDMDSPHMVKYFTDVWLLVRGQGSGTNINVSWSTNFGSGPSGTATLDLEAPGAKFDTAVFDSAVFAAGANLVLHAWLASDGVGAWGRYLQLRFDNSGTDQPFTVVGFIVKYTEERDRDDYTP